MCNNWRKVAGASKVTKTRVATSTLGLLNPQKCQHVHQEQEVYHRLYKDKLEKLAKDALYEQLPELQNIPNRSEDEDDSDEDDSDEDDIDEDDSDGDGDSSKLSKAKPGTEPSSMTQLRALCIKI